MPIDRIVGGTAEQPFPIHAELADTLAVAHGPDRFEREPTVAHVLGTCAAYAYSDTETVSEIATRLGLARHACVRVAQTVDAMFIFSTAYLIQSRCGRVVILCYRGTEPSTLGNWLGDVDVGQESSVLPLSDGTEQVRTHAGFHRNVRATSWQVLRELTAALQARSLADHEARVEHPLEALYLAGHSLGGAMAQLFALAVWGNRAHARIAERLRAVYTFGQPMAVAAPLPPSVTDVGRRIFRHVLARDPVPALPPAPWGPFVHIGREYRIAEGEWVPASASTKQLSGIREIPRSAFALFTPQQRHARFRYAFDAHAPHQYVSALQPQGRPTEFGD